MSFTTTHRFKLSKIVILFVTIFFTGSLVNSSGNVEAVGNQQSSIIRVDTNSGTNMVSCGSEKIPCRNVQYAINKAVSGDEIRVARGRYTYEQTIDICQENLNTTAVMCIVNKVLTIKGGYAPDDWSTQDGLNRTIIDGEDDLRGVLVIKAGQTTDLNLDGFIVQNGLAQGILAQQDDGDDRLDAFGGGMLVDGAQSLKLKNIMFKKNRSVGMDTDGIESDEIEHGGSGAGGGLALRNTKATLTNLTFEDNEAIGGEGDQRGGYSTGGGLHVGTSTVEGENIQFYNNISRGGNTDGSGMVPRHEHDEIGERGDALGAGASFQDGTTIRLQNVTVHGNRAIGGNGEIYSGGAFGAGIFVEKANADLKDVDLRINIAQGGEGKHGWLGRGGGAEFIDSIVLITNLRAIENQANGGDGDNHDGTMGDGLGGGLSITWTERDDDEYNEHGVQITNAVIADNTISMGKTGKSISAGGGGGAGMMIQAVDARIAHLTLVNNRMLSKDMRGAGIILIDATIKDEDGEERVRNTNAVISNSIIANHRDPNNKISTIASLSGSRLGLQRPLWVNNSEELESVDVVNASNPLRADRIDFVDAVTHDYKVLSSSLIMNLSANSAVTHDIDNIPRDEFPDLGAHEIIPMTLLIEPEPNSTNSLYLPIIAR